MTTALELKSLYSSIDDELEQVRRTVEKQWTDAFQLVYGPAATPPRLGGKLLRPALSLLSAGVAGADDTEHFVDMAAAMELLHLAALAHDDVVDSAALRRGETSLNKLWDNHTAVLGGDYLVAEALTVLTRYDSCAVIASALESIHEMAEGELIDFGRSKGNLDEMDCIRLARKKTASLFAVACCTPSLLLNTACRGPLHAYGLGIGTAFQLIDDLLDLEQDESVLGKPSCGDIVEGKTTLPILYMLEEMSAAERTRFDAMRAAILGPDDRAWIIELLQRTGARERTIALSQRYVDEGVAALAELPPSSYRDTMRDLAEFIVLRQF